MDIIFSSLQSWVSSFNEYAKEYPFVAGSFSLWFLGAFSYLGKDIPNKMWLCIKKNLTTTVTLSSSSESFHLFLKWYQQEGYAKKGRYVKISNGMYGNDSMVKSIGYGTHYFWYNSRLIVLTMNNTAVSGTDRERDDITLVTLGRSHKIFDKIFDQVTEEKLDKHKQVIMKFIEKWWERSSEQRPRKLDSIFLCKGIKEKIEKQLIDFQKREEWSLDHGIPYQLGILLYGPPGTGKSSIIKALANHFRYPMHILSSSRLASLENAMFTLPEKAMIILEDIDTEIATSSRENSKQDVSKKNTLLSFTNLSDILNAIDGIHSVHGRILIATTNHLDQIDAALLRPGRIDLKIKIDFADNFVVEQFFKSFYPDFNFPDHFNIRKKISSAYIQNLILNNLQNPQKVIKELNHES